MLSFRSERPGEERNTPAGGKVKNKCFVFSLLFWPLSTGFRLVLFEILIQPISHIFHVDLSLEVGKISFVPGKNDGNVLVRKSAAMKCRDNSHLSDMKNSACFLLDDSHSILLTLKSPLCDLISSSLV